MEAVPARFMLPDDIILEILPRVQDVAALFRCATACKAWRRLLAADRSFLRRCLSEKACRSSPFAGFFAQIIERDPGAAARWFAPVPTRPALFSIKTRPVLGPAGLRSLGSFVLQADPGVFDDAVPLVSRHGLLLLRLNGRRRGIGVHLAVCNLLAGTFQLLPRLEGLFLDSLEETGYALLTAADIWATNDEQQQPAAFKVLVTSIREQTMVYSLRTYSSTSEPARWSTCSFSAEYSDIRASFRQPSAVVCGGVAHWLLWGSLSLYTLEVSAKTGHVSFTMLPAKHHHDLCFRVGYDEPHLSVDAEEERLTLIYLQKEHLRLEFWTWNDDGSWITARAVELKQPDRQEINNAAGSVLHWCMGEKNGAVIVKSSCQRVYVADFKTPVMQEITDWPRDYLNVRRSSLDRKTFVPVEMDWPAYFLSRLGHVEQ